MNEKLSILLVEDHHFIAISLQIRLRAGGYDVSIAASVAEAMECVSRKSPDVAVLDVNLPDGNGIELMQRLATLEQDRLVSTIIIMSASQRPGLREDALDKGARAFLEKPFTSASLIQAIEGREDTALAS